MFFKLLELSADRNFDYQLIKHKGNKEELTFKNPNSKKRESVTGKLDKDDMDNFLSILVEGFSSLKD